MFNSDDINDKQMELGFIKLRLYDRMVDLCGQSMTLFASILEGMELEPSVKAAIGQLGSEMHDVIVKEQEIQAMMAEEIIKENFDHSTLN